VLSGNDVIVLEMCNLKYPNTYQNMFAHLIGSLFLDISNCTFQAQLHRCLMTLEIDQENKDEFWLRANGSNLRFTIEFALITGLKCNGNEEDFAADVTSNNRLLADYFYGGKNVKKEHLIKCFDDKRWGSNDEDAVKVSILDFIHNFIFSQQNDVPIPIRDFVIVDNVHANSFHGESCHSNP